MTIEAVSGRPGQMPISGDALVVDIGGGMNPNPRADYVVDICEMTEVLPYGNAELLRRFSADRWVVHDICSTSSLPFADKTFDFAICTHLLEDCRDPIRACEEIIRVAKAGYIETPSMNSELTRGLESRHYAGRCHHRWLVTVEDDELVFRMKPHFVNGYWKTQIPRSWWRSDPRIDVLCLFWRGDFLFREKMYHYDELRVFIECHIRQLGCYPEWRYRLWDRLADLNALRSSLAIRLLRWM